MKHETLKAIEEFAKNKLQNDLQFCGVARVGDDKTILTSSDSTGQPIRVTIELIKE